LSPGPVLIAELLSAHPLQPKELPHPVSARGKCSEARCLAFILASLQGHPSSQAPGKTGLLTMFSIAQSNHGISAEQSKSLEPGWSCCREVRWVCSLQTSLRPPGRAPRAQEEANKHWLRGGEEPRSQDSQQTLGAPHPTGHSVSPIYYLSIGFLTQNEGHTGH
jgi:hypothetical protein